MTIINRILKMSSLFDDAPDVQKLIKSGDITTADKIKPPTIKPDVEIKDAVNRFVRDNPRNSKFDGGMLVKPSADGSRPGYAKEKNVGKKLITLNELAKYDLPISEGSLKGVFQSKDRGAVYKKIFKDNGITIASRGPRNLIYVEAPTKKQIDGVWKDTLKQVGKKEFTIPEKLYKPFQEEVLKIFDDFSKSNTPFSTSDIYYKLVENVQDNPRIFIPKKIKGGTRVPGEVIKRALGKDKSALLMDGNLQRIEKTIGNRKKLVEILSKGKSDINTLSKTLGISKKDLFAEADLLFDDIYRYTGAKARKTGFGEKYGYLKDLDIKDYKNLLNNLRGSGFEKLDERSLRALITDAYAETNPKKYSAAMSKLGEYSKINNELKQAFGFSFQLDHPLSFQALKDLKNVSPENLIRVNPIPENINKIKIGLDGTYKNILREIRSGNSSPKLLKQKSAIESLSTKLGVGKFQIDNTGKKVLSFGAEPFLKADIKKKMGENIFLQDRIAKNLKNIDSQLFTDALGKRSKVTKSIQNLLPLESKKVKGLIPFMKDLGIVCKLSDGVNCMNPQAYTKSLNELTEKAAQGDTAAAAKLKNFSGKVAKAGKVIKGALGPLAIASEFALEGGIALNKTLSEGVPFKQAFGESYLNKYLLGPKLQIDVEAERAKEFAKGQDFAMAERGRRMMIPQSVAADERRLKQRQAEMNEMYPNMIYANPTNEVIDRMLEEKGVYSPYTLGFGMQQKQPGIGDMRYNEQLAYDEIRDYINSQVDKAMQENKMSNLAYGAANFAGGGIAGLSGGAKSGPAPESGKTPHGLPNLFKRVRNY